MLIILSRDMRFPTMWYVGPAKPQIILLIRAVWSEPLLVACVFYECSATDWTSFGVSKIKRSLHRLVSVCICQNATLLEITYRGSYIYLYLQLQIKRTTNGHTADPSACYKSIASVNVESLLFMYAPYCMYVDRDDSDETTLVHSLLWAFSGH